MVDALDALTLGGLPSQIALVGGTPLVHDVDVPTTRFGTSPATSRLRTRRLRPISFTSSFAGDAGLTVTFSPSSFTVAPGAIGDGHGHPPNRSRHRRQRRRGARDHHLQQRARQRPGGAGGRRPRSTHRDTDADRHGRESRVAGELDRAGQPPAHERPHRRRSDLAASINCCTSAGQSGGASIVATVGRSSVTWARVERHPGGHGDRHEWSPASRSLWAASASASPLGALTVPVTFFKGYGLRLDSPSTPDALAVSSAQSGSTTVTPTAPSTTFYSTTPARFTSRASGT